MDLGVHVLALMTYDVHFNFHSCLQSDSNEDFQCSFKVTQVNEALWPRNHRDHSSGLNLDPGSKRRAQIVRSLRDENDYDTRNHVCRVRPILEA
jgi:hypothetical protein